MVFLEKSRIKVLTSVEIRYEDIVKLELSSVVCSKSFNKTAVSIDSNSDYFGTKKLCVCLDLILETKSHSNELFKFIKSVREELSLTGKFFLNLILIRF